MAHKEWGWQQSVKLYAIRKKWPQLINWEEGRARKMFKPLPIVSGEKIPYVI